MTRNYPASVLAVAAVLMALSCCSSLGIVQAANDTLAWNESLSDGEFLTSPGGNFRLGFFSPAGNSSGNRYVGVWYNNIPDPAVVWVANPQNPVRGRSGRLGFNATGALVIMAGVNDVIWSSGENAASNRSSAQLLDTGNLFVTESANSDAVVWQGFDHPSNTLLPMMQIAQESTGMKTLIRSWQSPSDPSPGRFMFGIEMQDLLQMFTWEGRLENDAKRVRSGPWVNQKFIGMPEMNSPYMNGFDLSRSDRRLALSFALSDKTRIIRFVLGDDGVMIQWNWDYDSKNWTNVWRKPDDRCDIYNVCGDFGVCDSSVTPSVCRCLRGFEPKFADQWSKGNWSGGCRRTTSLQCQSNNSSINGSSSDANDGFFRMTRVKSPDFADWIDIGSAAACESWCRRNCSCLAYAYISGINCVVWDRRLVDVRIFSFGGDDLYLKLPYSELGINKSKKALAISLSVVFGTVMLLLCALATRRILLRRKRERVRQRNDDLPKSDTQNRRLDVSKQADYLDMVSFEFEVILGATDHFSDQRKLGEGGFGSVYKGTLPGGQEVAVKRLSITSRQGCDEFKNEVVLISKLQHRNLVQLLGCCANEEEKLLIYEFMPNNSLNHFLFDACKGEVLDWSKRDHIIQGIAHGLLYLHRDSRLRIIHRDLKASNILLDSNMSPKISDFGMARIVGDQSLDKTSRVVGTFGYMAPEYAMQGEFSEKSDVFSFGVLLLEIISGKKITSFYHDEEGLNLVGYAWKLWNEDKSRELIEPFLLESALAYQEITKCIKIGLLCVQEFPRDRPNMSAIVSMFVSDVTSLPTPKEPAFIGRRDNIETEYIQDYQESTSTNEVTITELLCR